MCYLTLVMFLHYLTLHKNGREELCCLPLSSVSSCDVRLSVCLSGRSKSLLLLGRSTDRHQTCTQWSPGCIYLGCAQGQGQGQGQRSRYGGNLLVASVAAFCSFVHLHSPDGSTVRAFWHLVTNSRMLVVCICVTFVILSQ